MMSSFITLLLILVVCAQINARPRVAPAEQMNRDAHPIEAGAMYANKQRKQITSDLVIVVKGNIMRSDFNHRNGFDIPGGNAINENMEHNGLWPTEASGETVFYIPRKLQPGDQITVTGQIDKNAKNQFMKLNLMAGIKTPDPNNVPVHFESDFTSDITVVKSKYEGMEEEFERLQEFSQLIISDSIEQTFSVTITIKTNNVISISSGSNDIISDFKPNSKFGLHSMKFLSLQGTIEKISMIEYNLK